MAKDNHLKPRVVVIPQLDPLAEIDSQMRPKQGSEQTERKPKRALKNNRPVAPDPDDMESYKSKYFKKEEQKVTKTIRLYKWRNDQLEREIHATGLSHWQIIDIGLEMYFRDKIKRK
jgi:hypothetical protein